MMKMKNSEKITAIIDAFIELAQNNGYEDSQIGGLLTDVIDWRELNELGYEKYVRAYFEED